MFKTIKWNTGSAAARFRSTRKKIEENRKKNRAASAKLQEGIDYEVDNIDDYIKRVKSSQAGGPALYILTAIPAHLPRVQDFLG